MAKGDKIATCVSVSAKSYLRLRQLASAMTELNGGKRVTTAQIIRDAVSEYLTNHKDEINETVSKVFKNPNEYIGVNLEDEQA